MKSRFLKISFCFYFFALLNFVSSSRLYSQEIFHEDFESGNKSKYSSEFVELKTGLWTFDEALIGKDSKDAKNGNGCARIRSGGKLTMNFDKPNGIGEISIAHATFGKDKPSDWKLAYSTNQGNDWKIIEAFHSTDELKTSKVFVNASGNIRIEIRSDSKGRTNIDDISITNFSPTSVTVSKESNTIKNTSEEPHQLPPLVDSYHTEKKSDLDFSKDPIKNSEIHVALGIPKNSDNRNDFLIARPQYVISYNKKRNALNWASWNVNASWYGKVERHRGKFLPEPELPKRNQITHDEFSGSGYDRGHMVRSDERTSSASDNITTFYMSNILAQEADLNQGVWLDLENYCKELAVNENKELFIIAGGIFDEAHPKDPIGKKFTIQVPNSTWKIVVVLNRGEGLKNVASSTRVIVVNMPNQKGVKNDRWRKYLTTVRDIEKLTGFDFLSAVPKPIQDVIETKLDNE